MTKGRVVLVPFPFDDLSTLKVRPALCFTDPIGPNRHVIVAFITSRLDARLSATDILLDPNQPDFAGTGLKAPSTLKLHRVITITAALIRREPEWSLPHNKRRLMIACAVCLSCSQLIVS